MQMTTNEAHAPRLGSSESVVFRPMVNGDRAFFASSWLKSYRRADAVRGVEQQTYFYFHHRLLERLVARSKVVIACDRADPDRIYGFACFEELNGTCVLHYVYVRKSRQGLGIGSALLDEVLRVCAPSALVWTHQTRGWAAWIRHYCARAGVELARLYNPYMTEVR